MEWTSVKLGDVCQIKHGFAFKGEYFTTSPSRFVLSTPGNFAIGGGFKLDKPKYYDGPIPEDYILKKGDIIVTMTDLSKDADTLGYSALVPDLGNIVFMHNQRIGLVHSVDEQIVDRLYLYWIMRTFKYQKYIVAHCSGSTVHHTSPSSILSYDVEIPPLSTQHSIASILTSLDAKIENNNRINRNLEEQAQALFKSWFVDFDPWGGVLPEDWKEVTLDDITSKFGTGLNPRKNFVLGHGSNYYVTIKNMGDNRVYLDDKCDKVDDEAIVKINRRSKLSKGDLLFSGIGTIGRVAYIDEEPVNWNTSESVFNMHPSDGISSNFIYLLLLSDVFQNYVKIHAQGGVQQGIRMASLKAYTMHIPSSNYLSQFENLVAPVLSLVRKNHKENDRLATLRDTLLPKLMKGEIEL